jgi:hypothetical protein
MPDTEESVETVDALFWNCENMLLSEDREFEDMEDCVETDKCCA